MRTTGQRALSVTELNTYVKMTFESSPVLSSVAVCGELSNMKLHSASGHLYFTLKDAESQVKGVMFRTDVSKLRFSPDNGMRVLCTGSVRVYIRNGEYQLYASSMEPDGIGSFYIAYEQLKAKLDAEGLFSPSHKRRLPAFPDNIGVITSQTGAAVRDIINITKRRYPLARITVYPALVQGDGAAPSLINGLRYFNSTNNTDVIIIGRGGGSIEDLWAFNSEALAREIYKSKIPVISAVGHETDFTICDFVADVRAPTPSAAAELAVPDISALLTGLKSDREVMSRELRHIITSKRNEIEKLSLSKQMSSFKNVIDDRRLLLDNASDMLTGRIRLIIYEKKSAFSTAAASIQAQSPLKMFEKGYTYMKKEGKPVTDINLLAVGDELELTVINGSATAEVKEIRK